MSLAAGPPFRIEQICDDLTEDANAAVHHSGWREYGILVATVRATVLVDDPRRGDADPTRNFSRAGSMPDWAAAMSGTGMDGVEQAARRPTSQVFRVPPEGADRPIGGVTGGGAHAGAP